MHHQSRVEVAEQAVQRQQIGRELRKKTAARALNAVAVVSVLVQRLWWEGEQQQLQQLRFAGVERGGGGAQAVGRPSHLLFAVAQWNHDA